MAEPLPEIAAQHAMVGAGVGAAARVLLALHGGQRGVVILLIEAGVGAMLGVAFVAAVSYYDPTLRDGGFGLLIAGGGAGVSGAIGTRMLDMAIAWADRRLGNTPPPPPAPPKA